MNKVILMGRLTRDPEIITTQNAKGPLKIAHYSLAVDRRYSRDNNGANNADFFRCSVFGAGADFAEKYFHKGIKILVTGRLTTNSYTNKDGVNVNSVEIAVEEQEFAESKAASSSNSGNYTPLNASAGSGVSEVTDEVDDEDFPWNN